MLSPHNHETSIHYPACSSLILIAISHTLSPNNTRPSDTGQHSRESIIMLSSAAWLGVVCQKILHMQYPVVSVERHDGVCQRPILNGTPSSSEGDLLLLFSMKTGRDCIGKSDPGVFSAAGARLVSVQLSKQGMFTQLLPAELGYKAEGHAQAPR